MKADRHLCDSCYDSGPALMWQLLCEMDGVEASGRVMVVAATNRPDMMDAALLRPGRYCGLVAGTYMPLTCGLSFPCTNLISNDPLISWPLC